MSPATYKTGDRVKYRAIGGAGSGPADASTTTGQIIDVMTETQSAGSTGVAAQATPDDPRYLIRNDSTGKETAYKAQNIVGKAD